MGILIDYMKNCQGGRIHTSHGHGNRYIIGGFHFLADVRIRKSQVHCADFAGFTDYGFNNVFHPGCGNRLSRKLRVLRHGIFGHFNRHTAVGNHQFFRVRSDRCQCHAFGDDIGFLHVLPGFLVNPAIRVLLVRGVRKLADPLTGAAHTLLAAPFYLLRVFAMALLQQKLSTTACRLLRLLFRIVCIKTDLEVFFCFHAFDIV